MMTNLGRKFKGEQEIAPGDVRRMFEYSNANKTDAYYITNTVSSGSQHTVGRYIRTIAGLRVIISVDRVTVVVISRVHLVADAVAIRLGIRTGVGSGKMQAEIKCLGQ